MADVSLISGTIAEFIDGALIIVILMIIYYIVRLFIVPPPSKEERAAKQKELDERRAKFGEWVGTKFKERKHKAQKEQRKGDVSVVKDNIKDALEGMEDVHSLLNKAMKKSDLEKAKKELNKVKDVLRHAVHNLRLLRRKHEGDDRKVMEKVIGEIQRIEKELIDDVEDQIPPDVDSIHSKYVSDVKISIDNIIKLRGSLGGVWNELEDFHVKFGEKGTP